MSAVQLASSSFSQEAAIELYKSAQQFGIIDLTLLQEQVNMAKRDVYLGRHMFRIWEDNSGWWNTYLPCPEGRKRIKKHTRKEIEDVVVEYYKDAEVNPTFAELYNDWIENKLMLNEIQSNTKDRNDQVFKRHFAEMGKRRVNSVSPAEFSDFLCEQVPLYCMTSKGFSNLKGICKGFLLRAKKHGYIKWNVVELFGEMTLSRRAFRTTRKEDSEEVFDREETATMLRYLVANIDRQNAAILLTFLSGLRCGEVVALKHVDILKYGVVVRRTESRMEKTNSKVGTLNKDGLVEGESYFYHIKNAPKTDAGFRQVVLPEEHFWLLEYLDKLSPDSDYVFVDETGKRMTTNVIRRRLLRVCKHLGIAPKSPHKIRKTYASILIDAGLDNNLVIKQMGHTNISMTESHYHRDRKDLESKIEAINSLEDFHIDRLEEEE